MTLKEMSRLTGYSKSTISKALNDGKDIGEITKIKIKELAKYHNYTPNNLAISFRKQRTMTVAVIVPDILNPQFARLVSEAQKSSFNKGLKLLFFQHFENIKLEKECVSFLKDGTIDGVIIISSESNRNYSSYSIPIPKVIVKIKHLDSLNIDNKEITDDYFDRLIGMMNNVRNTAS